MKRHILTIGAAMIGFLNAVNAQVNVTLPIGSPANSTPPYYGLWMDSGITVTNGEWVNVNAAGVWNWGANILGDYPDGTYPFITDNYFLGNSIIGGLIAFVGPDPFQGHTFGSFFPQPNYWQLGTSGQFMSNTNGELWLGFNDDAQQGYTADNSGLVTATVFVGFNASSATRPLLLTIGSVSSNTFSFSISNGIPNTVCSIFDSSDLTHWTLIDSIMLDANGSSMYASNSLLEISASSYPDPLVNGFYANTTGVPYRFYKVCDGQFISKTIGFVRLLVGPGTTNYPGVNAAIANQLDAPRGNTLDGLFNPMPDGTYLPAGSEVMKWNGSAYEYYTWDGSSWGGNGNVTLNPGEGAFLVDPSSNPIPVTFIGSVREGQSSLSLPKGQYSFTSSILPKAGYFQTTLGYNPNGGDEFLAWSGTSWLSSQYSVLMGRWNNGEPLLKVGEAFMIWPSKTDNVWTENYSSHQF